jgi:hypothetical protein
VHFLYLWLCKNRRKRKVWWLGVLPPFAALRKHKKKKSLVVGCASSVCSFVKIEEKEIPGGWVCFLRLQLCKNRRKTEYLHVSTELEIG